MFASPLPTSTPAASTTLFPALASNATFTFTLSPAPTDALPTAPPARPLTPSPLLTPALSPPSAPSKVQTAALSARDLHNKLLAMQATQAFGFVVPQQADAEAKALKLGGLAPEKGRYQVKAGGAGKNVKGRFAAEEDVEAGERATKRARAA